MTPQEARAAAVAVLAARERLQAGLDAQLGAGVPLRARLSLRWREDHLHMPVLRRYMQRAAA